MGRTIRTLVEQAIIIAECAVLLRYVRAEQTAAIDRCRDPATVSHRRAGWSCAPARARLNQFDVAHAELTRRLAAAPAAGSANRPAQRSKKRGAALAVWKEPKERDETEAMRAAMPQLKRLARYERRTSSRLARAVRRFQEIQSWLAGPSDDATAAANDDSSDIATQT